MTGEAPALGSPTSIPVDKVMEDELEKLKAGQDSLQQLVADKLEVLEKEGHILRTMVNDLKESMKNALKKFQEEREGIKEEAEKGVKESIEQGQRAEQILEASQKAQENVAKEIAEMAAMAAAASEESQKAYMKEVEKLIEKFSKFEENMLNKVKVLEKSSKTQGKSYQSASQEEKQL